MINPLGNNPYTPRTGDLGTEYDVQWSRFQAKKGITGGTDFKSSMFLSGVDGNVVLQRIENHIEGDDNQGNGKNCDLLSWDKYLESDNKKNDILFQNKDKKTFTNVDFNNDKYEILDEKGFSEKLGMNWGDNGKPYDVFEISQNKINFYEFDFGGLDDKNQANAEQDFSGFSNARWGLQKFTVREVDTSYWNKPTDDKNYESLLSKDSLRLIKESMPQWMTDEIETQLSTFEVGSPQYLAKFYAAAIKLMDQTKSYTGPFK